MFEEKLAYQLDERMRDMHEMIDNCHNRVSPMKTIINVIFIIYWTVVAESLDYAVFAGNIYFV